MLVTVRCEVTLTQTDPQKVLFHTDKFVFRNEYEISTDVKSFFGERSEEHTSELQSHSDLVCRLLLEKKKQHTQPVPTVMSRIRLLKTLLSRAIVDLGWSDSR